MVTEDRKKVLQWTEKYRPKDLSEISSQKSAVAVLKKIVMTKNLPHLLLYGPAGTGKTSAVLAMAKELFGAKNVKNRVLELNASDDRGIETIRTKVKQFASLVVANPNAKSPDGSPLPGFKIIILDEADWMTRHAQNALRRVMESFSDITRFCLICNYSSKIISPIASRCCKFRFMPLEKSEIQYKLNFIAKKESIDIKTEALETLISVSGGDLRRAITILQTIKEVFGESVTSDDVYTISSKTPPSLTEKALKVTESNDIEKIKSFCSEVTNAAFSIRSLVSQMVVAVAKGPMNDLRKAKICQKLAEIEERLLAGSDPYLQLLDALCYFM